MQGKSEWRNETGLELIHFGNTTAPRARGREALAASGSLWGLIGALLRVIRSLKQQLVTFVGL